MRVAGKLKVYGVQRRLVGEVRLMNQQDDGFILRDLAEGQVQIRFSFHRRIQT